MSEMLACLRRKNVAVLQGRYYVYQHMGLVSCSGRCEALFACRDPGISLTRLVMLLGSSRAGGDAHEFDLAWGDSGEWAEALTR